LRAKAVKARTYLVRARVRVRVSVRVEDEGVRGGGPQQPRRQVQRAPRGVDSFEPGECLVRARARVRVRTKVRAGARARARARATARARARARARVHLVVRALIHSVSGVSPRLVPLKDGRRTEGALAPPPRDVVPVRARARARVRATARATARARARVRGSGVGVGVGSARSCLPISPQRKPSEAALSSKHAESVTIPCRRSAAPLGTW
jgi:hypothetical protein